MGEPTLMLNRRTPIKVVFFGSPEFAVPCLRALGQDRRFELTLVVTQPDRPAGRGKSLRPPAVKVATEEVGINLIQPKSVNDDEVTDVIRTAGADLFVVVAYGEKLGRNLLAMPPHSCLNVHPSLLPCYRGSSPIPAAILNGDGETGISIIRLTRRLDSGPIVSQTAVRLHGNEETDQLSSDLSYVAAAVLPEVAAGWCRGAIVPTRQDHARATYTAELTKADGRVDWRDPAELIERQVRALSPWPGCWTVIAGRRLTLNGVAVETTCREQGELSAPGSLVQPESGSPDDPSAFPGVATGDCIIRLLRVTPEGKREMSGSDWWRGSRLGPGA